MSLKQQVLDLHHRHPSWTPRQIAEAMDCDLNCVYSVMSLCKLKLPSRYRRLQKWEVIAIMDAYVAGEKCTSIEQEFNITPTHISYYRKKLGIPARPKGKYTGDLRSG